jgi:SlyX protein
MSDADRIARLEMIVAEQERTIEDLSGQVAEQWTVVEKLRRKLDLLTERFLAVEEQSGSDVPVTRPPHW